MKRLLATCAALLIVVGAFHVSKSQQSAAAPPGPLVLTGDISGDRLIAAKEILIPAGTTVHVLHGATLQLDAERIYSDGYATIDGTGDAGAAGGPGTSKGEWCTNNRGDLDHADNDCHSNPSHADRGGPGQQGEKGGPGGSIILNAIKIENVTVKTDGGPGGPGGPGGAGRWLYYCPQHYCNGCTKQCPNGATGATGPQGDAGHFHTPKFERPEHN